MTRARFRWSKWFYIYKSSISGEFVDLAFYHKNPTTTYRSRVRKRIALLTVSRGSRRSK